MRERRQCFFGPMTMAARQLFPEDKVLPPPPPPPPPSFAPQATLIGYLQTVRPELTDDDAFKWLYMAGRDVLGAIRLLTRADEQGREDIPHELVD